MAVSRNTEHRSESTFWQRVLDQLTRYDLVLTVIPLVFALAVVTGIALAVPYELAVGAGALFCLAVVADALFLHPPVGDA